MDPDASLVDPTLVVGSGLLLDVPTPVVDAAIVEEEPVAVEPGEVITNTERPEQEEAVALAVPTTHTPSASGEEAVVEDELLQDILATDMDDLVEAMSHRSIQQSTAGHHSDDVDMASIATPYGGFSLHDLFGQHFHTELMKTTTNGSLHDTELGTTAAVYDPELLDSRTFVEALFGSNVDEAMIDTAFGQEGPLRDLMLATAAADARSDVEDLFGLHALSHMEETKVEDSTKRSGGFAILHATLPNIPAVSDKTIGELWLAELPRVDPNRQVLHVEPTSFHPSRVTIPRSNDRRLYTADNVMRWAYLKERKEVLSNARLVKWSDGSRTVHVGRDRFEIASSTQQSLSLLSAPTTLYKSEKVMPGVVGVQGYEQRVLLKVSDAPSISSALVSETQAHRHIGIERRLSVLTDAPLPRLDAKKPRNEMTPAEEWVMKEREKRRKEMVRLAAAGTPMSLADQLEAERRMIQTLQSCEDVKELLDAQDEEIGHAVSADTRRQRNRREVAEPTMPYQDFETLLAGMNAESNPDAASRKRERSEEPQEEEARLHLNRSDAALTVDASRKDEAVAMLERVQSLIPETSEVSSYIGSITTMLGDAAHNWTLSSLQAELSQITSDIRSELGSSAPEEAIQMLASLQR